VTVASRRSPEESAAQARTIAPTVVAKLLQDALEADTIILAIPFESRFLRREGLGVLGMPLIDLALP